MNHNKHWEQTYSSNQTEALGWYTPHLQTSLSWIRELGLDANAPIIDVGGGASTLVDDLLEAGQRSITVLDISDKALSLARARLGEKAKLVKWLEGNITSLDLPAQYYELWHDRAVFHFLTARDDREKYVSVLRQTLAPGGHLIIMAFAIGGPSKCSGLDIVQYDANKLTQELGPGFELLATGYEVHITPAGNEQKFMYFHLIRSRR